MPNIWESILLLSVLRGCLSAPQWYYPFQNYRDPRVTQLNENQNSIRNADLENAKFAGVSNQETGKGFLRLKQKFRPGYGPCIGRDANNTESGRFLWDLNVYNVYTSGSGCGGSYGGGIGGGLLSDASYIPPRPGYGFFGNFLSLFVPGGALNPTGGIRPQATQLVNDNRPSISPSNTGNTYPVDPVYDDYRPSRPNYQYDPSTLTPGQLVGGVAQTVNSVIQTLSGNVRPPGSYLRGLYDSF